MLLISCAKQDNTIDLPIVSEFCIHQNIKLGQNCDRLLENSSIHYDESCECYYTKDGIQYFKHVTIECTGDIVTDIQFYGLKSKTDSLYTQDNIEILKTCIELLGDSYKILEYTSEFHTSVTPVLQWDISSNVIVSLLISTEDILDIRRSQKANIIKLTTLSIYKKTDGKNEKTYSESDYWTKESLIMPLINK
ncbi:MAG: hypothetical protein KAR42_01040 [candidate division Zixibacteria bacterium]|nr:hypothetical protein [candidate division Zixibacteria bacterium]